MICEAAAPIAIRSAMEGSEGTHQHQLGDTSHSFM